MGLKEFTLGFQMIRCPECRNMMTGITVICIYCTEERIRRTPMLYVKQLKEDALMPTRNTPEDSGLDLYVLERTVLRPGVAVKIDHGFACQPPEGYETQIRPRSSSLRRNIHVAFGTCDQGYRGEIASVVMNLGQEVIILERGDRVSQLVVAPVALVRVVPVSRLSETDRGAKGWGSSGTHVPADTNA